MRACKDCEYYQPMRHYNTNVPYENGSCHFNPPTVAAGNTTGLKSDLPDVKETSYCSKWEPVWHDSEVLNKAWNEFLLIQKMARTDK